MRKEDFASPLQESGMGSTKISIRFTHTYATSAMLWPQDRSRGLRKLMG